MTTPTVFILTHCFTPLLAYGSLLTFQTLRTGYPTAPVHVVDNGSDPAVVPRIKAAAEAVGASFEARRLTHYSSVWEDSLFRRDWGTGPVAFVDPDCVFWENCEGWDFGDALLAGRLVPGLRDGGVVGHARLHPSHLWVPSFPRLRAELARRGLFHGRQWDAVGPAKLVEGRETHFWDTLSPIYEALSERCARFGESHLNSYDHLFWGSHLPLVGGGLLRDEGVSANSDAHRAAARGDLAALRGIWRRQDEWWQRCATGATRTPGLSREDCVRELQAEQGIEVNELAMNFILTQAAARLKSNARAAQVGSPRAPARRPTQVATLWQGPSMPEAPIILERVAGKRGIEIGGPSAFFRTTLPAYPIVKELDAVNFWGTTLWEGQVRAGRTFRFDGDRTGHQFIAEATDMAEVPSGAYHFVLSSNCLEHVANPLKALAEWRRVLVDDGALVLVLPKKSSNFDHRRPFTTFEHLLQDYENDVFEDDLTHLDEILALHDLSRDPPAGSFEQFKARSLDNLSNRALHHHVFEPEVVRRMLHHAGFEVLIATETARDYVALAMLCRPQLLAA
jgi:SAM-dependent methyltransferase